MNKIDKYMNWFTSFLLSKTIIIVAMILFLSGIVQHLNYIFENWFISIACQLVILLTTINSRYLPSIKTKYGIDIPFLGLGVSIFMFYFIFMSLSGHHPADMYSSRWILNIVEALFFAAIELIFAYLCTTRIYEDLPGTDENRKMRENRNDDSGIDIDFE